ncbi:MAG TPA: ABC transporter permease, partial [Hyphomonas sp.]|nr:ABC transporter permease [Hyphomonas sp.]
MADTESQDVIDRRATEPAGGQAADRPKGRSLKPLKLLLPYAGRHWRTVAVAVVFLVAAAALSLSLPLLLGRAADSGRMAGGDSKRLLELVNQSFLWVAAAAIASGV